MCDICKVFLIQYLLVCKKEEITKCKVFSFVKIQSDKQTDARTDAQTGQSFLYFSFFIGGVIKFKLCKVKKHHIRMQFNTYR